MAVLSKIRQRSLLLILIIGFSLFAFILGSIIKNGGFGSSNKNVGSVNGTDIPAQDFMQQVNQLQTSQRGISTTQASNSVWNQRVEEILFQDKFDKNGIRVGRDHVINMYAQNPQVSRNPQFLNAVGQFDKEKFNEFLVNMKKTNPQQWAMMEANKPLVEDAAKKQLYIDMLKAGFVTTQNDGKAKYELENNKVDFDYVFLPDNMINDDEVPVSDQEITDYMKKHEDQYKSEASRQIEFVKIENKPSADDEMAMQEQIKGLIPELKAAENNQEFVNSHSDIRFDTTYVAKKDLPVDYAQQIFDLQKGDVFGPYTDNGYNKITKMIDRKANASANVSHILIAYKGAMRAAPTVTRTKEEAKAKAEELLKKINSDPASFAALAKDNSDDPGSAQKGGIYEDITPGMMVKPFNDFVFNNPVGKTGVVETDFGYHVIKVLAKQDAVQIATVAQLVQPSEKTSDELYTKASKLEMEAQKGNLEDLAKKAGYQVTPATKFYANDENIQGLGAQRAIVKWAFDDESKVGDVKKFDVTDGYVIARLKAKNEKGLLPMDEAKEKVAPIIRDQKKAEKLKEKMQGGSLEEIAQKTGSQVATATGVTLGSPMVQGVGPEPTVVGRAFALGEGKTSDIIVGKKGIFKIKTTKIEKAPALPNYSTYVNRMQQQDRGGVNTRIVKTLKDKADIEDNRAVFN